MENVIEQWNYRTTTQEWIAIGWNCVVFQSLDDSPWHVEIEGKVLKFHPTFWTAEEAKRYAEHQTNLLYKKEKNHVDRGTANTFNAWHCLACQY